MVRTSTALSGLALSALLLSCSSPPVPKHRVEPPLAKGCNPLGGAADEDCLLPFPSSHFTVEDTTTPTGLRVSLPIALMPRTTDGVRYDVTPQNGRDGWSPATTLLAY